MLELNFLHLEMSDACRHFHDSDSLTSGVLLPDRSCGLNLQSMSVQLQGEMHDCKTNQTFVFTLLQGGANVYMKVSPTFLWILFRPFSICTQHNPHKISVQVALLRTDETVTSHEFVMTFFPTTIHKLNACLFEGLDPSSLHYWYTLHLEISSSSSRF